jgi:hypothetical protein
MKNYYKTKKKYMKVAFVGDSVLDNFYWLKNPKNDIKQQLSSVIPNATVYNFAVDESRIKNVLRSITPATHYSQARKKIFKGTYDYPCEKDGKVRPLKLLKNTVPDYIVLSVGGNDGRIHLNKLMWSSDALIKALTEEEHLPEMMEKLVKKLIKLQKKLILVFVYKPHVDIFEEFRNQIGWGLQYLPIEQIVPLRERLDDVYNYIRGVYFTLAKKYQLPVIDLSRTFDCNNRSHYGSTVIEPSNFSGQKIADLIAHVIQNHDYNSRPVCYYSPECSNAIVSQSL